MHLIKHCWQKLQNIILPPANCVLCGANGQQDIALCAGCYAELPWHNQACASCGNHLPDINYLTQAGLCGHCIAKPPAYQRLYALFSYQAPITKLVNQLKFSQRLNHARLFSELIYHKVKNDWYANQPLAELIIPIPLHKKRLQQRGFNQALEIARPLGKRLDIKVDYRSFVRHKNTQAQSEITALQRAGNVKNAFSQCKAIEAKSVIVIDDVATTNNTLDAFCRVLQNAGVQQIHVWCCGKTQK